MGSGGSVLCFPARRGLVPCRCRCDGRTGCGGTGNQTRGTGMGKGFQAEGEKFVSVV
jgi:hypothetical protein